ncbi:MAG: 4-hydroxythreonine-4-phosphate dehydrogenase PdxA [Bradymonadales bacterium]|nr:MAG: 4-hydroxythreonine-4-phosphate dehydrogenase PdxA [Bradymonadales bacterium]
MRNLILSATCGDPASIGPEVCIAALKEFLTKHPSLELRLFGPSRFLEERFSKELKFLKQNTQLNLIDAEPDFSGFQPGRGTPDSARRALLDLRGATQTCLRERIPCLITGPVDKSLCAQVESNFRGQTEFLMRESNSNSVCMLLESSRFKVALVTTHLPLREVPDAIRPERIERAARHLHDYLKALQIEKPLIAVCGLNPHASDHGLIGTEENEIIAPAIKRLQDLGIHCEGPFPADSLFAKAEAYDGILAMYHDQGLIPIKTHGFFDAINISLGLPFLRLSVDHGTAFGLVGKNEASSKSYYLSLEAALRWAERSSPPHS